MGTTEDELVGWHHQLNRHEFEQAPGDGGGQGGLACCSSCGHKKMGMTERLDSSKKEKKPHKKLIFCCTACFLPSNIVFMTEATVVTWV